MILYVIDDDSGTRRHLQACLKPSGITVWPFAHADLFLEQLPTLKPAPILIELRTPPAHGLGLLSALAQRDIRWPAIAITARTDATVTVEAMKLGATEVLDMPLEPETLAAALDRAFERVATLVNWTAQRGAARARLDLLTERERNVVRAMIVGQTNKAIAQAMAISPRTVEGHRAQALRKLNVSSVAEMVYVAVDGGLAPRERWLDTPELARSLREGSPLANHVPQLPDPGRSRFDNFAATSPDGILCADHDGRIIVWNAACETLFGFSTDQALGQTIAIIDPRERGNALNLQQLAARGAAHLVGTTATLEATHRGGSKLAVTLSLSMWREDGQTHFGAIIRKTDAPRRAEPD